MSATAEFDGATYSPQFDGARLATQLERVKALMLDGRFRTLKEIATAVGGSEAGVSARLRDCRKTRFGGIQVHKRRRGDVERGVWEYRFAVTVASGPEREQT